MDRLRENIMQVNQIITESRMVADYDNGDVILVGASKTMPLEVINKVIEGKLLRVLGENRAQELRDKYVCGQDIEWHYIGSLQSSNVRIVVPRAALIHSLDRYSIAEEINKYCMAHNLMANCLLQVNMGREESKSGFYKEDILQAIEHIKDNYKSINLSGIMAVVPMLNVNDSSQVSELIELYKDLGAIFSQLKNRYPDFKWLSAGMTNDFHLAIRYAGSNMVRVGRAIFGDRG